MDSGTKEWWMFAKWSDEYEWGVDEYVQKAFASKSQGNQICCPCESCHYRFWRHKGVVRDHLICNGFVPRTDKLSELGINFEREQTVLDNEEGSTPNDFNDDIVELLHDARDAFRKGPNDEAKKFFKLVEEGREELFPGCKNHSKLSFMIRLFILKCDHKLTNVAFGDILELIKEVLPDAKLPASFNEAKSLQPIELEGGSEEFPRSRFWMSLEQKRKFCQVIKNAKLPQGSSEGSMAEGNQAKECVAFIARFLKRSSKATPEVNECGTSKSFFPKVGHPIKGKGRTSKKKNRGNIIDRNTWAQAHRYVLFNCHCEEVEKYIRKRKWNSAQDHSKDFMDWFREKVDLILKDGHDNIPDHILWLSKGPSHVAKKYTGYSVNGYRFYTMKRDANCVTQNSGVTLTAITHSFASSKDQNPVVGNVNYYGSITEIIEISYHGHFSVVLFRCQWFHSEKDDDELITVNMNKTVSKEEPFILATQAHQVFYVEDLNREGWHYAVQIPPREFLDERMEARGSASVANKILEEKTKALICPSARQNSVPENEDDDSTSEYDGENEVETDDIMEAENVTSGKRKASKQFSKQVKKTSLRPKTMADVVEVNSCKKHAVDEVQSTQKKQQVISEKKGTKRAFCSPSSMSAYLEFRKRQKENNDGFVSNVYKDTSEVLSRFLSFSTDVYKYTSEVLFITHTDSVQEPPDSEPEKAPKSKRHRGPTMLPKVHARTREEREVIVLNSLGQPIGPTREIVQEFKQFLGTGARDSELAPLNYIKFPCLPTLDKMWEYVQAKMDDLESSQHEDGSNSKDPYSEVIPEPKRKSRVRLQGKGVKKSDLKKKEKKKSDFIFPAEFLENMQAQLVQQLAPSVTTAILTQLRDANPGINLVIPDFAIPSAPKDAYSAPHLLVDQNRQSSKSGATINQLDDIFGVDRANGLATELPEDSIHNLEKDVVHLGNDSDNEELYDTLSPGLATDYTQPQAPPAKRMKKEKTPKTNEKKRATRFENLSSIDNMAVGFPGYMKDMNNHLATIASAMSTTQEREQEIVEQKRRLLSEIGGLPRITQAEVIRAVSLFSSNPSQMEIFYSSPNDEWKKEVVLDLLSHNA
uniref:Uncharacterized protein n=1 Tax=Chenopodium quinoa TaxID=63459 RepID=A0A803LSU4_CHEQI